MMDSLVVPPVFDVFIGPHGIYHDSLLRFAQGQNKKELSDDLFHLVKARSHKISCMGKPVFHPVFQILK